MAEKTGKCHDSIETDEEWKKRHVVKRLSSDGEDSTSGSTYAILNVVALGDVGAGKSAVLNSIIGHPVLPTGDNGVTRGPIIIDLSSKVYDTSREVLARTMRCFLQEKLTEQALGQNRDEIYFKLRTNTENFRISNIVRLVEEIPGKPYIGTVVGGDDTGVKISWADGTESTVHAKDIELIEEEEVGLEENDFANVDSDADPNDDAEDDMEEEAETDMEEEAETDMEEDFGGDVTTDDAVDD